MEEMTLREVCEKVGVSRRAIQGYEKLNMVHATGKNKYGHLLYDINAVEIICKIKMYRDLGFSVKTTKEIMESSEEIRIVAIRKKILEMNEEVFKLKKQIMIAEELIQNAGKG